MTPEYLEELADMADPDQLWRLAGLEQLDLPADKRRQLDAGVALRRHASHTNQLRELLQCERSLLITPLSDNSSAIMAIDTPPQHQKLREARKAAFGAPPMVDKIPDCGEAGHDDGCCGNLRCLPRKLEPSGETMRQREEVCAAWHALPDDLRKDQRLTRLYHALGGPRMEEPSDALDMRPAHYRIESVKYLAGAIVLRTLADANVPQTVEAGQVVTLQLAYSVPHGVKGPEHG